MSESLIYLDYAASTPVDARVAERVLDCYESTFANPSSSHAAGRRSQAAIETAASQVARLLNVDPETLIWTSGATESDNLAIAGQRLLPADEDLIADFYGLRKGRGCLPVPTAVCVSFRFVRHFWVLCFGKGGQIP